MGLHMKLIALTALLLVSQGASAAGANASDPNLNPDSSFRLGLKAGVLCDKMKKGENHAEGSIELASEAVRIRPANRGTRVD